MCIERLYPYLDRELTEDELGEVQDHLNRCPPCAKHFDYEAGVLRFVGDAGRSVCAPQRLLEKILAARTATVD
jgi:mycothiol system anti-sigma-R factor